MAFMSILLIMPMMMAFGFFGLILLAVPLGLGAFLQLIFCIVAQEKWVVWMPAVLGGAGLAASLIWLLEVISLKGISIYWVIYFVCLWLVWLIVDQIKKAIKKWQMERK